MNRSAYHNCKELLETIHPLFLEFSSDGTIREWSPRLAQLTGWNPDEIQGLKLEEAPFWNTADISKFLELLQNHSDKNASNIEEGLCLPMLHANGSRLFFEWKITPIEQKDHTQPLSWLAQLHNVTSYHRKAVELDLRVQREKMFMEISNRFINVPVDQIDNAIDDALGRIGDFEGVDRSYIFQVDGSKAMNNTHEWCAEGIEPQKEYLQDISFQHFRWWMRHLNNHQTIYIPDVNSMPAEASAEQELLQSQDIKSVVVVPLISSGRPIGFLGFDAVKQHKSWSNATIELLSLVADAVVQVLERKKTLNKLQQSEERWEKLVQNHPETVQITIDGEIVFLNQAGAELYGADMPSEVIGHNIFDFAVNDDHHVLQNRMQTLQAGLPMPTFESKLQGLNHQFRIVEVHSVPIRYNGQSAIQSVLRDVTHHKKNEQQIRDSLREKETLLSEIHHRVKNNLAVISGLLELQAYNASEEDTIQTLQDSQSRIQSMAMVHEKLYQSETLSRIRIDDYIAELSHTIIETFRSSVTDITLDIEADEIYLDIKQAVPLGLLVNELIVNGVKHAFRGREKGVIRIDLDQQDEPDQIDVSICDDGVGLPDDFSLYESSSLGSSLIATLSEQLDAQLEYESEPEKGTCFSVTIPVQ